MDPLTNYEIAKLRIAERHQEAARARMATPSVSFAGAGGADTAVVGRSPFRRLVGRINPAHASA